MEQFIAIAGIAFNSFGAGYLLSEFREFRCRLNEFSAEYINKASIAQLVRAVRS